MTTVCITCKNLSLLYCTYIFFYQSMLKIYFSYKTIIYKTNSIDEIIVVVQIIYFESTLETSTFGFPGPKSCFQ